MTTHNDQHQNDFPENKQQNLPPSSKNGKDLKNKGKKPGRFGFFNSVSVILVILFLLSGIYSFFSEQTNPASTIPLSELVHDISVGQVASITVRGDDLIATYQDKTIKNSKKENDSAVTETFARYGLTPEKLSAIKITVEGPGGFWFWIGQVAPFLLPLIFLAIIIWFLTRQGTPRLWPV